MSTWDILLMIPRNSHYTMCCGHLPYNHLDLLWVEDSSSQTYFLFKYLDLFKVNGREISLRQYGLVFQVNPILESILKWHPGTQTGINFSKRGCR